LSLLKLFFLYRAEGVKKEYKQEKFAPINLIISTPSDTFSFHYQVSLRAARLRGEVPLLLLLLLLERDDGGAKWIKAREIEKSF
jgi:hypothetical protein